MLRGSSGQLTAGLSALRPRLARCPGPDGYKLLMLEVRTLDQEVEILDVSAAP